MKALIIRFSSFGDIVQSMPVLGVLKQHHSTSELHWLVRSDFQSLLAPHPLIQRLWAFDRRLGLVGLWHLSSQLANERFTHIYDAHNNVRSRLLLAFLRVRRLCGQGTSFRFVRRPKNRIKRWLLFRFHWQWLPSPFVGQISFLEPLQKWDIPTQLPPAPTFFPDPTVHLPPLPSTFVALVPSAAWEMKRWPLEKWADLIRLSPKTHFVLLGGPEDHFCADLEKLAPERVHNLAGKLTLAQSCALLTKAALVVANDTGLLHVADSLGRPVLALIGPTAFGYPARSTSETYEVQLWCKPCSKDGRGKCRNKEYQACMKQLSVDDVQAWMTRQGVLPQ